MGFLGSVSFAALVLVIQAKPIFNVEVVLGPWTFQAPEYFEALLVLLALTSFLMIEGSIASARVAALKGERDLLRRFAQASLFLGEICFALVLPMLILAVVPSPANQVVGLIFLAEGLLIFLSGALTKSSKKDSKKVQAP